MKKISFLTMLIFMFSAITFAQEDVDDQNKSKSDTAVIDIGDTRILILKMPKDSVEARKKKEDEEDDNKKDNGSRFFLMDIGLNTYLYNRSASLPKAKEFLNVNLIRSRNFSLIFYKQGINLYKNNLKFIFGVGLDYNNYVFDNNNTTLVINKDSIIGYNDTTRKYSKSKLATIFWNVPVGIRIEGDHKKDKKGIRMEAGINISYFYSAHSKRVIEQDKNETLAREWDGWHVDKFRYGPYLRVGYRKLEFFANYSLTPLFKLNKGPRVIPFSFGVALIGF